MNDQVSGRDWAPVSSMNRVCMGPGKPGKSWNLLWHLPGLESPGKRLLALESSGNLLNSSKKT